MIFLSPEKEETTKSCSGQANYATTDYLNPKFKPQIPDDLVKSKKTMMFVTFLLNTDKDVFREKKHREIM